MYRVLITGPAQRDIQAAHDWWAENRSAKQAMRWYLGIHAAIKSLRTTPERCSEAPESDLLDRGLLRQLLFGLGRQVTHRVVFAIDGDVVVVFRVRHTSQDVLKIDELE